MSHLLISIGSRLFPYQAASPLPGRRRSGLSARFSGWLTLGSAFTSHLARLSTMSVRITVPMSYSKVDYEHTTYALESKDGNNEPFRQEVANIASDLLKRKHGVTFAKQVREKK